MKKSKTVYFIGFCLGYLLLKAAQRVILPETSVEYQLLSHSGLSAIYYGLGISTILLSGAALKYVYQPRPVGFFLSLTAFGMSLASGLITLAVALSDKVALKNAIIIARVGRLTEIRPEEVPAKADLVVNFMSDNPVLVFLLPSLFIASIGFLVIRNRDYFLKVAETKAGVSSIRVE